MLRLPTLVLLSGLFVLAGGLNGQDTKKDDPKPAKKEDEPKPKKDDAPVRLKGTLPKHYKDLGLSDDQKQEIFKLHSKYNPEIEKVDAKLKELKSSRDKEVKGVLTPDQKKRLDDILTGKDK